MLLFLAKVRLFNLFYCLPNFILYFLYFFKVKPMINMIKYVLGFLLSLNFTLAQANMAKPYNEGSEHSILFSSKSIDVLRENINIKIIQDDGYFAKYQIKYELNSPSAMSLPLLFIAANLFNDPIVRVNGQLIPITRLKKNTTGELNTFSFIKPYQEEYVHLYYEKNESTLVRVDDLAYFITKLKAGQNTITVEYNARLETNNFGFTRNLGLEYSLFPSKYWKSFGPIHIDMQLPEKYKLGDASIGNPDQKTDNHLIWTLKNIPTADLRINLKPVVPLFSAILLFLDPLGISALAFLVLVYFHVKLTRKHRLHQKATYNWNLAIGNLAVPPLTYLLYFCCYNLVDWTLGDLSLGRHGYVLLLAFTLPVFWVIYTLVMWLLDLHFKKKFITLNTYI